MSENEIINPIISLTDNDDVKIKELVNKLNSYSDNVKRFTTNGNSFEIIIKNLIDEKIITPNDENYKKVFEDALKNRTLLDAVVDKTDSNVDEILNYAKYKNWLEFKHAVDQYVDDRNITNSDYLKNLQILKTLVKTTQNPSGDVKSAIRDSIDSIAKYESANAYLKTEIIELAKTIESSSPVVTSKSVQNPSVGVVAKESVNVKVECNETECCVKKSTISKGGKRLARGKQTVRTKLKKGNKKYHRVSNKKRGAKKGGSRKNNRK